MRKSSLNFCMYTTLGQGQEMTLTFNTHISSYILPIFRSLAAIVSEISTVSLFPIEKPKLPNLT